MGGSFAVHTDYTYCKVLAMYQGKSLLKINDSEKFCRLQLVNKELFSLWQTPMIENKKKSFWIKKKCHFSGKWHLYWSSGNTACQIT